MALRPQERSALTREKIRWALTAMLKEQALHRIAIRDLCSRAGINRTTFYNHYGSQYDVLAEIRDGYLRDVAETIGSADAADRESVLSRVTLVLTYAEQNLEISRLLIMNNVDATFAERLFSLPKIGDLVAESRRGRTGAEDRDVVAFAIHGSYKLIQQWIALDRRRSPGEMAALLLKLSGAVCAS